MMKPSMMVRFFDYTEKQGKSYSLTPCPSPQPPSPSGLPPQGEEKGRCVLEGGGREDRSEHAGSPFLLTDIQRGVIAVDYGRSLDYFPQDFLQEMGCSGFGGVTARIQRFGAIFTPDDVEPTIIPAFEF